MFLSRYERMIARRYLLPGSGEPFIVLVGVMSLVAVMLGVAALIIVMSVMNGFRADLIDKIVGWNGQAIIQAPGRNLNNWRAFVDDAKATPGITSATPVIDRRLMASYNGRVEGVRLRGLGVGEIRANPAINAKVVIGSILTVVPGTQRVAIGSRLAESLGSTIGSEISLISAEHTAISAEVVPRIVNYTVGAIFETGVPDYDTTYVIMPMSDAQTLLQMGDTVSMIELQTSDPELIGETLQPLIAKLRNRVSIVDWRQMNAQLFEALVVERVAMFTVLSLIILVAVFNILSSLIMLVRSKSRDIAILRTMGATRSGLIRIFIVVGTTVGAMGVLAGLGLGFILLYYRQPVIDFLQLVTGQQSGSGAMGLLVDLPSRSDPVEISVIAVMALVFSFLATLYPAFKAASTDPVQILRHD